MAGPGSRKHNPRRADGREAEEHQVSPGDARRWAPVLAGARALQDPMPLLPRRPRLPDAGPRDSYSGRPFAWRDPGRSGLIPRNLVERGADATMLLITRVPRDATVTTTRRLRDQGLRVLRSLFVRSRSSHVRPGQGSGVFASTYAVFDTPAIIPPWLIAAKHA